MRHRLGGYRLIDSRPSLGLFAQNLTSAIQSIRCEAIAMHCTHLLLRCTSSEHFPFCHVRFFFSFLLSHLYIVACEELRLIKIV